MTAYVVYDVFTDEPFGGNPLAVIPDATGIDADRMQAIAREFGFSETTFVLPPDDPAHTARVRIFTPGSELAFAGHPTVGTAVALADAGGPHEMVLELGVGPVPAQVEGTAAAFTTRVPLDVGAEPDVGLVAAAVGLPAAAVRTDRHRPVIAGLGTAFVLAELADLDALAAAAPELAAMRAGAAAHPGHFDFATFVYVRDGTEVRARMFAPLDGIPEDPATGSAAAALAALLAQRGGPGAITVTQGVEMGRRSVIEVSVAADGDTTAVTVRGRARRVMAGTLFV